RLLREVNLRNRLRLGKAPFPSGTPVFSAWGRLPALPCVRRYIFFSSGAVRYRSGRSAVGRHRPARSCCGAFLLFAASFHLFAYPAAPLFALLLPLFDAALGRSGSVRAGIGTD